MSKEGKMEGTKIKVSEIASKLNIFKKKPKTKKEKNTGNPPSGTDGIYYDVINPPNLPDTPIPKLPRTKPTPERIYNKEVIVDLPLQHVPSKRRMDDLDDKDYIYTTGGTINSQPLKKDVNFEDVFMDAEKYVPCKDSNHSLMISRFFFSPQEQDTVPSLPTTPIPSKPQNKTKQMTIRNKTTSVKDLPIQSAVIKRMEGLSESDYVYTTSTYVCRPREDEEHNVEEMFRDAKGCAHYQDLSCSVMINKCFFSPKGNYEGLTIAEICQEIENNTEEVQQDVWKFIVAHLIPDLKTNCNIHDTFSLLCCKNKNVKSLCIYELTEMILNIDPRARSCDDLKEMYKLGTIQLLSVITDTKKTSSLFQPLMNLGIVFNCFIYLKVIEAKDDWIEWIHDVKCSLQSKMKQTMEKENPDVQIFVKTVKCIFDIKDVNMDNSILIGEDLDELLPECSRADTDIYIEGLAYLYHTGNLVLRQLLKFQTGVQRLVKMVSFMNSSDEGMTKWFHCLLGQYVLRILQKEHNDDLNFHGVPVRWAAPESLLEGHYSIYSDVWSVNILADEILNYAAWPYSDISDADINDLIKNIVFTNLRPQGFNRPRRIHGLILEGLSTVPSQRLKLEVLQGKLKDILDTDSGVEGCSTTQYEIPRLTERQIKANSIFERGIPLSIQSYREREEDPYALFVTEVACNKLVHKNQTTTKDQIHSSVMSSNSSHNYDHEEETGKFIRMEEVTNDFVTYTYPRLEELGDTMNSIEPWPPEKRSSANGYQLHYKFKGTMHLLDIALHKDRGETIGPYIELLYELAQHVDTFHSAGWILRCLRAKHVWINFPKFIVVPKIGKYRKIVPSKMGIHLEQIKVEDEKKREDVQWLPIEAIKANLYSKESDVYAFGMITWEVMTAFGQEGNIYHDDEDTESLCIPFNYQQSENILAHLVEGYIPEKPLKCPDWFYQKITRPCLLHQKIDRPSMKKILNILGARLHKNPPKQIFQRTQGKPDDSKRCDSGDSSGEPLPEQEFDNWYDELGVDSVPQSQQLPVSEYENWDNDCSFKKIDLSSTEESKVQDADIDNVYDDAFSASSRLQGSIPSQRPNLQKQNNQIAVTSEAPDSWVPPVPFAKKDKLECFDDQNNAPSILRRSNSQGFFVVSESSMSSSSYTPVSLPELSGNEIQVMNIDIQHTDPSIQSSSQMTGTCKDSDFVKFDKEDSERGFDNDECFSIEANKERETPLYLNATDARELDTEPPPIPPRNY
uniref:Uncharacterized protein LOC111119241 isoform X2 n=1 Tax=Crassostrea virginica TaxID=6565 RepID=A0A8B8CGV5_CRAVI|nr:uncharacterized protein LOC111119241 isoform X2 [Crassostrea virginica]